MTGEPKKTANVLTNRNFRLVFLGALVSDLGALLYNFAVGFFILEISGNNAFLQGLYLALCGAALLVFTPIGGVLGDRFNKAKIMYACDFLKGGMIVLATALMLLFPAPGTQLAVLFVHGILSNAVSGVFSPASGSLYPRIVAEEQLQQANAYRSAKDALQGILGVILAGVLYAALPIHTLFFLVGACYLASGVSETLIRYDHRPSAEPLTLRLALRDMRDGVVYVRDRKAILALLGTLLFLNFFITPVFGNFTPYFVRTDLANAPSYLLDKVLTPELWSSVFSMCFGVSSLIGAAVLSTRPQAEKCGLQTARRLCAEAAVLIALTLGYWILADRGVSLNAFLIVYCLGFLVMGLLISFVNIPLSTALMRIVDKDKLSKVTSIVSIGAQGMIPLASVLAGAILSALGSTPLLAFSALGSAVTAALMLRSPAIREI